MKTFHKSLLTGLILAVSGCAAMATPWQRTYVLSRQVPAFYYGGDTTPAEDCPKGINPPVDRRALISQAPWRTKDEIEKLLMPENIDALHAEIGLRGAKPDTDVWLTPEVSPDPGGLVQVAGKTSYGFDLDHNPHSGGFTSPDGIKGIDNAFYRTTGCFKGYRGPKGISVLGDFDTDTMSVGGWSILVTISGNADPMNDNNATVDYAYSVDGVVKDSAGNLALNYTFRPLTGRRMHSVIPVTIHNGVVTSKHSMDLRLVDGGRDPTHRTEMRLYKGQVRLTMSPDGSSLTGLIGGYRKWKEYFVGMQTARAGAVELQQDLNLQAWYYALKRNADGMPDPMTKKMTAISTAYSIWGVQAIRGPGVEAVPSFVDKKLPRSVGACWISAACMSYPDVARKHHEDAPPPKKAPEVASKPVATPVVQPVQVK